MNILQKIYHLYANRSVLVDYKGQEASNFIKEKISLGNPLMVARLGSTELQALVWVKNSRKPLGKILSWINKRIIFSKMHILSGFFPSNKANLNRFYDLMLTDMKDLDILGSWRQEEKKFSSTLKHVKHVRLMDLEPYYHVEPWSIALKNKKILVIHPFDDSITEQFKKRQFLFENKDILPDFELFTIKAVQTIAGNDSDFSDWFHALDYMKNEIDKIDFDIALIGCGAYGFPLAAHIKRKGKIAIQMGGALQILFGIKGKRWENHPVVSKFINSYWVKPNETEIPKDSKKIDGGSYW